MREEKSMAPFLPGAPDTLRTALRPLNRFLAIACVLIAVGCLIACVAERDLNYLVGFVGGGLSAWAYYLKNKY
jgi:hypothetical protein